MSGSQSVGQPSVVTSSRGSPNGMSMAATHGPGVRNQAAKRSNDSCDSSLSSLTTLRLA